jgi:TP901 family phage tail tape measure protein
MARTIVIRITVDNREAINSIKAQRESLKILHDEIRQGNEQQKAAEMHALRVAKANKTLETSQKSLVASIAQGYIIGKAVSAIYTSIAGSLGTAAKNAVDFEFQMAKINAITGAGSATLASLEATIRNVSAATALSQNELAKTALEMSKLGLSSRQVQEALVGVAQLSRALDEDLVSTGETVVAILNTYNFSASEAGRVTDQLAFTVKASALDIQKFGTAFSYVGGTAAAAGVSFEELQGAMDILSNAGIKSSTIGTQLRRIIADLSDENSKASQAIGGQTIQTLGLVGALEALRDKNIDIGALTEIFGRTASSVADIAIKYSSAIGELANQTRDASGLTKELSDLMQGNLKTNLDGITSAWTDLGIEIFKSTGFLNSFAVSVKNALLGATNLIQQGKDVSAFKEARPEEFKKVLGEHRNPDDKRTLNQFVTDSPEFKRFNLVSEFERIEKEQRENIVDEIKGTFQQDFVLPKDFNRKTDLDKIPIEETRAFQNLQALYGGDENTFQKALARAQLEFALKLEKVKDSDFDTDIIKKPKKPKKEKVVPDFDPMDVFDRLGDLQPNGDTYAEKFMKGYDKKRNKAKDKSLKDEARELEDFTKDFEEFLSLKSQIEDFWAVNSVGLQAFEIGMQGVTTSIDIFSGYLSEGLISKGENPFKGITDAFGDMAKKLTADLIALVIRLLAFKAVLALVGQGSGIPFFSFAFNKAGGNGLSDFALSALGGQNFSKNANGFDGTITKPHLFLAGEAGPERVKINPVGGGSGSGSGSGSSGGVTNIYVTGDIFNAEKLVDKMQLTSERSKQRYV